MTSKYDRYSKEELIKIIDLNSLNTPDKALASHKLYRQPLMVMKESSGRWMTLRFNEKTGKLEPDAIFRVEALTEY